MKMFIGLVALALFGCATVIAPGDGHPGDEARARLAGQAEANRARAVLRAIAAADAMPDDLRAQRKAAELAKAQLRRAEVGAPLYQAIQPTLRRLEQHPEACTVLLEAGETHDAAGELSRAAEDFVASVKSCRSTEGLHAAVSPLRRLNRCGELVKLAAGLWPSAEQSQWVRIMDSVRLCSDPVSLRRNLSFVPPDVQNEYFNLLAARQEENRRLNCSAHCRSARSSCEAGCWSSSACYTSCASLESACLASCS